MIPNRAPSTVWLLRHPGTYPNGYVLTRVNEEIRISFFDSEDFGNHIFMSRQDARLLAKRINQCLDATVKR